MAIHRYIVSVEVHEHDGFTSASPKAIADEMDSNLESVMTDYGIEHFTIESIEFIDRDSYRERVIRSVEQ